MSSSQQNKVVLNLLHVPGVFWAESSSFCPVFLYLFLCLQMVSSLFLKHSESLSQQRSNMRRSSTARRYQANTVSAKFQTSLEDLLNKIERFEHTTMIKVQPVWTVSLVLTSGLCVHISD